MYLSRTLHDFICVSAMERRGTAAIFPLPDGERGMLVWLALRGGDALLMLPFCGGVSCLFASSFSSSLLSADVVGEMIVLDGSGAL